MPSLVICELLGVPYADHDFFQENSKVIIRRDAKPEERAAGHQALVGYLDRLMGEKLAATRPTTCSPGSPPGCTPGS